jgi:bifunctional UDP-N-acetylglucosamine pyrophosphorylase/glucosamine-1-phosphate N-acetyltransferase
VEDQVPVTTHNAVDVDEVLGVNDHSELARLERLYQKRRARQFMEQGVSIRDPDRFDARGDVTIGRDCVIDVNVVLEGPTILGERVRIGPHCVVRASRIDNDATIHSHSVIEQAYVGTKAVVGPFARVRPGADIAEGVRIGNFVEIKNSTIAAGAKINHLAYVGDSSVGRDSNIGAGVITCNYDGVTKHRTEIGDDVFIGSNTQLVAPVRLGNGSTVGAGSTITNDVPEEALAVSRVKQCNISGWKRPKKK